MNKEFNEGYKFRGQSVNGDWYDGLLSISQGNNLQPEKGYYISNSGGMPWAYQVRPETIELLHCPKCKNIRYMDRNEVEKIFRNKVSNHFASGIIFDPAIKDILELAIPDNKKIKELEEQNDDLNMECRARDMDNAKLKDDIKLGNDLMDIRDVEISKLKAEVDNKQKLLGKYAGYIDDYRREEKDINEERDTLKAKLIECHNKNTELKGDISRGKG